jgi:methylated-DNA-protein-cysteine methyltransferase-like protein
MESGFFQAVYRIVAEIPRGKVVTYGQIARGLGQPRGARAVGWAMRHCPEGLPWHRVINAQGGISQRRYGTHVDLQRQLLEREGVIFDADGCTDLERFRWGGI